MPKTIKGKYIILSKEEFDSIIQVGNEYHVPLTKPELSLSEDKIKEMFEDLRNGFSQVKICEKYILSSAVLKEICNVKYGTKKISEVKDKLKLEFAMKASTTN